MLTFISFRIYFDFLVVISFLLIHPSSPHPSMLSHTQINTCTVAWIPHMDQQPFMLLDYCCRCCGFTLIKRHGAFSFKTTPSDTWVRVRALWGTFRKGERGVVSEMVEVQCTLTWLSLPLIELNGASAHPCVAPELIDQYYRCYGETTQGLCRYFLYSSILVIQSSWFQNIH